MKTFQTALRDKDLVISAELPLAPATRREDIRASANRLAPYVDALQVADDRLASGCIAALAVAAITLDEGVDAVLHMSCRDRNRVALQSDMLGATAIGVSTLVLYRGRKMPQSLRGAVRGVFDTSTLQLIEVAMRVAQYSEATDEQAVLVGTLAKLIKPHEDWQAQKIHEKIGAGARFLQTLPCLNVSLLGKYVNRLVSMKIPHRTSLIVGVPLLGSAESAARIRKLYPGAPLPAGKIKRVANAADPLAEGIEICAGALREAARMPGVSGVNIVFDGPADAVVEALQRAGLAD